MMISSTISRDMTGSNDNMTVTNRPSLVEYVASMHAESGAEHILAKICELLSVQTGTSVELGVGSDVESATTATLWSNGWKGVVIEPDRTNVASLRSRVRSHDVTCIEAQVTPNGPGRLEDVLSRAGVLDPVTVLSIHIKGDDWAVFNSLELLRPRVIVCEFNPTIPAHMDLRQLPGSGGFGCSILALESIAKEKGYQLVAASGSNAFFVPAEDMGRFDDFETSLAAIAPTDKLCYVISAYDGSSILSSSPTFGYSANFETPVLGKWNPRRIAQDIGGRAALQTIGNAAAGRARTVIEKRTVPESIDHQRLARLVGADAKWVLEIGTNDGTDTLRLASVFPSAQLDCFEPDPRANAAHKKRVTSSRVRLFQNAIGASNGTAVFHPSGGTPPGVEDDKYPDGWHLSGSLRQPTGHLIEHPWVSFDEPFEVQVRTLDSWAEEFGRDGNIDFIWADVQGAEGDLLAGGTATFRRTRYLFTEYSDRSLYEGQITLEEICRLLPGWSVAKRFRNDVLLRNDNLVPSSRFRRGY
jgi:2-O-methyltransferase